MLEIKGTQRSFGKDNLTLSIKICGNSCLPERRHWLKQRIYPSPGSASQMLVNFGRCSTFTIWCLQAAAPSAGIHSGSHYNFMVIIILFNVKLMLPSA